MSRRRVERIACHLVASATVGGRAASKNDPKPSTRRPHHREPASPFNAGTEVIDRTGLLEENHEDRFAGSNEKNDRRLPASVPTFQPGRVTQDLAAWSVMELIRRAQALGGTDEQLNQCVAADSGGASDSLVALVRSLEPPPPASTTVADITVERDASLEDMLERLHTVGALVIKDAADPALLQQVDSELGAAGAWGREWSGLDGGRMGMDAIMFAPSVERLLTSETALSAVKGLLGPSCRRVALKELEIFAIQPGQGRQGFHREDQFWPWHHEPTPWACSVLWALDDFTPENGGTRIIPYSHLGRMREGGREVAEGNFDESDVLKVSMPRGSVLIFTGGLVHGGGENTTETVRKSVLTGYQLGWLRPENKFHAYKPLHQALVDGQFSDELAKLMGHADRQASEEWSGSRTMGHYNGRRGDQVDQDDATRPYYVGSRGYEAS